MKSWMSHIGGSLKPATHLNRFTTLPNPFSRIDFRSAFLVSPLINALPVGAPVDT
jgi:hypothetical protein